MDILQATAFGMCFGVRDALELTLQTPDAARTTIWGELVHNAEVAARLQERGFRNRAEHDRDEIPDTPSVLITAHGISDRERRRLESSGKRLVDTTCPLVRRAHDAAIALAAAGMHVVVIGKPGHVEVEGLIGDLDDVRVIEDIDEVRAWDHAAIGVLCQTTTLTAKAMAIVRRIRELNPHAAVRVVDTICDPTKQRALAVERLAERVATIVIVGGKHSNNTRQLVAIAEAAGARAIHIEDPSELDAADFDDCERVGLTAGTSTPDSTIERTRRWLEDLRAHANTTS